MSISIIMNEDLIYAIIVHTISVKTSGPPTFRSSIHSKSLANAPNSIDLNEISPCASKPKTG